MNSFIKSSSRSLYNHFAKAVHLSSKSFYTMLGNCNSMKNLSISTLFRKSIIFFSKYKWKIEMSSTIGKTLIITKPNHQSSKIIMYNLLIRIIIKTKLKSNLNSKIKNENIYNTYILWICLGYVICR